VQAQVSLSSPSEAAALVVSAVLSYSQGGGLPVFASRSALEVLKPVLRELGIKYRLVSPSDMRPPYIFIDYEGESFRVVKVDSSGREEASVLIPREEFLEALAEPSPRGSKRVYLLYVNPEDIKKDGKKK